MDEGLSTSSLSADANQDENVSLREAYFYALNNDENACKITTHTENDFEVEDHPKENDGLTKLIQHPQYSDPHGLGYSLTLSGQINEPQHLSKPNCEWSIELDKYGRFQRLMYPISNTSPTEYRNEMWDWAGYVQYTPEGQNSVAGCMILLFPLMLHGWMKI
jgi:hypothetical protein